MTFVSDVTVNRWLPGSIDLFTAEFFKMPKDLPPGEINAVTDTIPISAELARWDIHAVCALTRKQHVDPVVRLGIKGRARRRLVSVEQDSGGEETGRCRVPPRTKTSFKGWELYIWEEKGETYFSLMFGTNRLKSREEIIEGAVKGIDAIKPKLDELKPGESVGIAGKGTGQHRQEPSRIKSWNTVRSSAWKRGGTNDIHSCGNYTMNSLLLPEARNVLERLHALADARDESIIQQVRGNEAEWNAATAEQKAALMSDALLPVSKDAGRFLYAVARSIDAKRIVEFGTSFGVSTIYFAAAIKDNGGGLVIGTELEPSKVAKANQHLAEAGLSEFADIRAGDAMQTLRDVGTVDLLFLDGWKLMYLDLLKLLMPDLRQGAVVLADDVTLFPADVAAYLDYVRDPTNGFVTATLPLGDGIEYSVKL